MRTVLGPSAAWHLAGTPGRPPSQVKAEEWSSPTPVASPRACTHGHQPRAWGAESFRRPQRRGTEHGSENVPRHPPANQSSPLTGTGDRGPGQLSFPPTCVTGSWPLREGGLRQTGNPGLATPWQPSSESGPGVGGLEGTPRGTGGFIFPGSCLEPFRRQRPNKRLQGAVWGQGTILLRAAQWGSIAVPVCRGP